MNPKALKARMAMVGISAGELCKLAGISLSGFYRKIRGDSEFTQSEISAISQAMELSRDDMCDIFFTKEVS